MGAPRVTVAVLAVAVLYAAASPGVAATEPSPQLLAKLSHKEEAALKLKQRIEEEWKKKSWNSTSDCRAPDTCADTAKSSFCSDQFGGTQACSCTGRKISTSEYVIKSTQRVVGSNDRTKEAVCYANQLKKDFEDLYTTMVETGDAKWIYYGSNDGVLVNYPGFLWPRSDKGCSETYDPRIRPWMMSAATGPKNVVFILDKSGSMGANNRMKLLKDATKVVLDSMTHADYVGAVSFSNTASTYLGLTTLSKALSGFRSNMNPWLEGLREGGGTNFLAAYEKAFELVDGSKGKGYDAGCHTTYVFVTDGKANSPRDLIQQRQKTVKDEHHVIIALGSGAEQDLLKKLACEINGIFSAVPDNLPWPQSQIALQEAMVGFYRLYALQKTLSKVEGVVWSEPYTSIPDIWGPVASASVPVYDRTKEPWHMVGVAAVDIPVCDLVDTAKSSSSSAIEESVIRTARGCTCLPYWTYNGATYAGCTMKDWAVPWCATDAGCGSCNTASVGPSNCWDDCKPTGPDAEVEELLVSKATAWCEPLETDQCQLEAVRPATSRCGTCANATTQMAYEWAMDGTAPKFADSDWVEAGYAAADSATTGSGDSSEGCQCLATMKPGCVCTYIAEAEVKRKEEGEAVASEAEKKSSNPGAAYGGGVVAVLVVAAAVAYRRRQKAQQTGSQPWNGGINHQQQQQQHMHAYPPPSGPSRPGGIQMGAAVPGAYPPPPGQYQHYVATVQPTAGAPPVVGQPVSGQPHYPNV